MVNNVSITNTSEFEGTLSTHLSQAKPVYTLFYGSWCPDCTAGRLRMISYSLTYQAEPHVKKVFEGKDVTLITATVERSEYRGNSEYPYRKNAQVQLKCVPTLLAWKNGSPVKRLEEGELLNDQKIEDLIKSSQ
ncbi:hypothetical protein PROFUN_03247 [Planoprotostelium fungivorum]|uniref:Thioredoxin domain-containing protein n=1 Tax=Planoprotostelium fungivorum TaxID=1890364 RepID=A0A2P6NWJ8_9EUKA|nr:hypothetical protein PROFUN_03247 [Planoprotostelium fungivorum]